MGIKNTDKKRFSPGKVALRVLIVLFLITAGAGFYFYENNLIIDHVVTEAGIEPDVRDFLKKADPDACFDKDSEEVDIYSPGDFNVKVKTGLFAHPAVLTVKDTTPPVIEAAEEVRLKLGRTISYRDYFETADNCSGEVKVDIDSSEVNLSKEGTYTANITVTDASGNSSAAPITVVIYDSVYSEEDLWEITDKILDEIFKPEMTAREKVTVIQKYVASHCMYHLYDNDKDWIKAAVDGFTTGKGDCYVDTCMGRALLTRAGIKNMEIRRVKGNEDDHCWNLVDIEDGHGWYHLDCINREDGHTEWEIILFDDAKLKWVDGFIGDYHDYDRSKYPEIK